MARNSFELRRSSTWLHVAWAEREQQYGVVSKARAAAVGRKIMAIEEGCEVDGGWGGCEVDGGWGMGGREGCEVDG